MEGLLDSPLIGDDAADRLGVEVEFDLETNMAVRHFWRLTPRRGPKASGSTLIFRHRARPQCRPGLSALMCYG